MQLQTIYLNGLQALCHWNHFWMLLRSLYALTPKDSLKLWTEHDLILIGKGVAFLLHLIFEHFPLQQARCALRTKAFEVAAGALPQNLEPSPAILTFLFFKENQPV